MSFYTTENYWQFSARRTTTTRIQIKGQLWSFYRRRVRRWLTTIALKFWSSRWICRKSKSAEKRIWSGRNIIMLWWRCGTRWCRIWRRWRARSRKLWARSVKLRNGKKKGKRVKKLKNWKKKWKKAKKPPKKTAEKNPEKTPEKTSWKNPPQKPLKSALTSNKKRLIFAKSQVS